MGELTPDERLARELRFGDTITALRDRVAEVERERDEIAAALKYCEGCWSEERGTMIDNIQFERTRATAAEAAIARLRDEVIEECARVAGRMHIAHDPGGWSDTYNGDVSAALRALKSNQEKNDAK